MHDVLRQDLLTGEPVCKPVGGARVPPIEVVERPSVAGRQPPVKFQVLSITFVHGLSLSYAAGTIGRVRVMLYSRPRCGLCDRARAVILAERERSPFHFVEVNVETDDALELEYGLRIPVVTVEGEERFEISVDPADFATMVRA